MLDLDKLGRHEVGAQKLSKKTRLMLGEPIAEDTFPFVVRAQLVPVCWGRGRPLLVWVSGDV